MSEADPPAPSAHASNLGTSRLPVPAYMRLISYIRSHISVSDKYSTSNLNGRIERLTQTFPAEIKQRAANRSNPPAERETVARKENLQMRRTTYEPEDRLPERLLGIGDEVAGRRTHPFVCTRSSMAAAKLPAYRHGRQPGRG